MPETLKGSCLCGAIKYEMLSHPKAVSHCHCSQCRKGHGAAFATYGIVPRTDLRFVAGEGYVAGYASSPGVLRQFCKQCGANITWSQTTGEDADQVSVALGTLDTPIEPRQQEHIEVASKASWYRIEDHWPRSD